MTMFDSFSKPGWQHSDPEVRKTAIDQIEDVAVLVDLVHNDPEPGVQAHALARISDSDELDKLTDTLPQPLQAQARAQRLKLLLPDASQLSSISDDTILVRIAGLADDPELIAASIGQLKSAEVRMDLAINHPVAKTRLCAAQGVEDIDLLKELSLQSKHKDKAVYRYCKELLDRHHAAERAEIEQQQQIKQLIDDARKLSTGVDSPEFKTRFQTLEHRWSLLNEHAGSKQKGQIEADLGICAERVRKLTEAQEAEIAQQAHVEKASHSFEELIQELDGIDLSGLELTESKSVREFAKSLDGIEDRWLAGLHYAQPSPEQTKHCKTQLNLWRAIAQGSKQVLSKKPKLDKLHADAEKLDKQDFISQQKLLEKVESWIKTLSWPESHSAATPGPILQLQELHESLQQQLAKLKKDEKKNLQLIETAFEELRKELEDNHFKNADRVHNRLRNLLRHLSLKHQDHFHHELRPLTARLSEIHDWQGFAIEPKKIELCEQMNALVGSEEDPDVLAVKIKAMQDEWKKLGPLSPRRDQALWRKFHKAADKAYKPCKQAFAQQSELRKENLKQRMALVAQLVDYDNRMTWPGSADAAPDSATPDWRMVQKTLDTARTAFNNIKPVSGQGERKSRKALQKVCDKIYGHIKDEYERNIQIKKDLVTRATALVELEELREAIDKAKGIQREWKEVGLTPRQVDRQLWKEFRSACDAVFGRLDDQRKQQNAVRNERAEEAKARAEQAKARALKEQQRWPNLLEKMRACTSKAKDEKKATKLWQKEGDIPREIETSALEAWWEQGPDNSLSDDDLRQACIALEVLVGADSPPEDKEARMAYQMQRLVEGMGSGHGDQNQQLLDQINEFIAIRPAGEWVERFCCDGKIIPQKT
jgi:exonuclease SbcC